MTSTPRVVLFRDHPDKARWIDGAAWIDARQPRVRAAALELAGQLPPWDAGRRIAAWIRDHVRYTRDRWIDGGAGERIADTATILDQRIEDCDGKARAFVALVRALELPGLGARVRAVYDEEDCFAHAQAELTIDGGRTWHLVELIVDGVDPGFSPELGSRNANGTLRVV